MATPPPITPESLAFADYCLTFDTRAGFVAEYERQLAKIWYRSRVKRGLKAEAYEATEQLYIKYLRKGRMYPDQMNFQVALSNHYKAMGKPENALV